MILAEIDLPIVPSGWVFSIWLFIYIALGGTTFYALNLAFRTNPVTGGVLLYDPPFLHPAFLVLMIMSHICNASWFFAMEGKCFWAGFALCFGMCLSMTACITLNAV